MTLSTHLNYTQKHLPEPYEEFDVQSYRNRYLKSYTVFRKNNGDLIMPFVRDITDEGWYVNEYDGKKWKDRLYSYKEINPLYYPIRAGLYPGIEDSESVVAIRRRLYKALKVGADQQNFHVHVLKGSESNPFVNQFPNILESLEINVEKALDKEGPLSKLFYLKENTVYYLDRVIGLRKKKTFFVEPVFKSEMEDCLRGYQCTISY